MHAKLKAQVGRCLVLGVWMGWCSALLGAKPALRPYEENALSPWEVKVDNGVFEETIRVGRNRFRTPAGPAVLFSKTSQLSYGGITASDDSGELRTYRTLDDLFKEDPLKDSGGGKLFKAAENPWVLVGGTAADALRFNSRFNCHSYTLGDAIGLTPSDWVEGSAGTQTENTNPADQLLSSYYSLKKTFGFDAPPAAGTEKEFRAAFLRVALPKVREVQDNTTDLQEGDVLFFTVSRAGARTYTHSGRLTKLGTKWGLVSKMGEANPLVVTSLELMTRVYAGQFNEIRVYRLNGDGPRAGTLARKDLAAWGARFEGDKIDGAVFRLSFQEGSKAPWFGTGFFLSPQGYFVASYDILRRCFTATKDRAEFSTPLPCEGTGFKARALYKGKEYPITVISHLGEADSAGLLLGARTTRETGTLFDLFGDAFLVIAKVDLPTDTTVPFLKVAAPAPVAEKHGVYYSLVPTPRGFMAGFNQAGTPLWMSNELNFLDGKQRGYISANRFGAVVSFIQLPPADDPKYREAVDAREGLARLFDERFPSGLGDGTATSPSLMGAPWVGPDGVVKGILLSGDPSLPVAFFLSRNVLLESFFTRDRPENGGLFSISAGETTFYLKSR